MAVKRFKPVTPGTRFRVGGDFSDITTNVPEKTLVVSHKRSGGRNHDGKMTIRNVNVGQNCLLTKKLNSKCHNPPKVTSHL